MESIYYIPKRPESTPLFDKDGNVSIIFDGEMIEISSDLFNKMFEEFDYKNEDIVYDKEFYHYNDSVESVNKLVDEIYQLKNNGVSKEDMQEVITIILEEKDVSHKETVMKLIDDIYGN